MILLSDEKLELNTAMKKINVLNSDSFKLINKNDLNTEMFFYKRINLIDIEDGYTHSYLADDVYTIGYIVDCVDDVIYIKTKLDLSKYYYEIFDILLNRPLYLNLNISMYIKEFIFLNPELESYISNNMELLLNLFKKSLNESIDSVSSICYILKRFNVFTVSALNDLGNEISRLIEINCFYNKELLIDLIYIGDEFQLYNTYQLKYELKYIIENENNELPF